MCQKYLILLRQNPLFENMDDNDIVAVLQCLNAVEHHYQKDEYLLREGDTTEVFGVVLLGSVMVVQDDWWGNRNIRALLSEGEVFAQSFACVKDSPLDVSVVASKECAVLWLNAKRLLTVCHKACPRHVQTMQNLLSSMASANMRLDEKLTHVSCHTTREKLLSYLSCEARKSNSAEFTIPFNRQMLADYLSVERSAMSAELSRMQRDGLIKVDGHKFTLCGERKNDCSVL